MMQTSLELQTLLVVHGVNNRFFSNKHIVTCSFINTAIMFSLLALLDHTIVWLQEQKCVKSKWVQEHDSSMRASQEFTLEAIVVQSRLRGFQHCKQIIKDVTEKSLTFSTTLQCKSNVRTWEYKSSTRV